MLLLWLVPHFQLTSGGHSSSPCCQVGALKVGTDLFVAAISVFVNGLLTSSVSEKRQAKIQKIWISYDIFWICLEIMMCCPYSYSNSFFCQGVMEESTSRFSKDLCGILSREGPWLLIYVDIVTSQLAWVAMPKKKWQLVLCNLIWTCNFSANSVSDPIVTMGHVS